jgi:hypothetical protein
MLYYGKLLHEAMRGWFKYGVTSGPSCLRLASEVELWVCHTEDFSLDYCAQRASKPGSTVP